MLRHYAQIKNTGSRVLVVFMKLPDDEKNCLLLSLDTMNDILRDEVRELVDSKEGQMETELYKFLSRKTLRAGDSGVSALNWLHSKKFMFKAPITDVVMTPTSQQRINLSDLLGQMEKIKTGDMVEDQNDGKSTQPTPMNEDVLNKKIEKLERELADLRGIITKNESIESKSSEVVEKPKRPYNKKAK